MREEEEGEDLDEAVGNDQVSKNPNESQVTGAGKSSVAAFDSKFFPKESREGVKMNKKITMDDRIAKMKDISASARKTDQAEWPEEEAYDEEEVNPEKKKDFQAAYNKLLEKIYQEQGGDHILIGEREREKIERQRDLKTKPSIKDRTIEIEEIKRRKT